MGKTKVLIDPTSMRCNKSTKKRFKDVGKYGETMDAILNRVMDKYEDAV